MMRHSFHRAGFTLLELLIALAIGSALTATGLSLYVQSVKGHNQVDAELAIQENAYYFDQILRQLINQAGYRPLRNADINGVFLPVSDQRSSFLLADGSWEQAEFLRSFKNGIALRFMGASDATGNADGSIINCIGERLGSSELGEIQLAVDNGVLVCMSKDQTVEILGFSDDVSIDTINWKIGIDTNGDASVDRFVPITDASATPASSIALRAHLLLVSDETVLDTPRAYVFDGVEHSSSDLKLRRESVTTIEIKN